MASPEKIKKFFEVAKIMDQYSILTKGIASQMAAHLEEGDEIGLKQLELQKRRGEMMSKKLFDFVAGLYENLFTDEDIDDLIAIYTSPAYKRLMAALPEMAQKMVDYLFEHEKEIEDQINIIAAQIEREFEPASNTTH